ncbi:hypothetical protein L6452_46757 [Arctium lappa]|nr:hypothetical protein L6452_46757 [Arctium lappa]
MPMVEIRVGTLVGIRERPLILVGSLLILVRSTLVAQAQLATIRAYDMVMRVCDALRCSGPHARYTDVFNEYIALADRPGKSLKFHRDGDRSLQLLVLNEEFLVSASHQLALTTCARSHSAEGTSAWASRIASPPTTPPQWGCVSFGAETGLPCPWCGWPKKESPLTDARLVVVVKAFVSSRADAREALSNDPNVSSCNDASTATPADGGRRCVPVGCGTARAGPPIDSGRGPVRIGAAAKARAVDMPVEMPSRRSWLAARAVTACLGTCVLPAPACGHPIRPVLKHGPRSLTCVGRRGCFVEPCHGIESSKWAIFGKQNWRCGMNRKPGYGAKLRANLEPTKGVGRLRQQDGGHGSRNPLRSVLPTLESTQSEVGSSGWKSTARRAVSGAPPAALENPEDRVPPTPGRTHNRISPEPVGCRRTARAASAARAGRRVPAGGRIGNGLFGGLPRASNSQLRTGTDKGNPTV